MLVKLGSPELQADSLQTELSGKHDVNSQIKFHTPLNRNCLKG